MTRRRPMPLAEVAMSLLRGSWAPVKAAASGSMIWPATLAAVLITAVDLLVDRMAADSLPHPGSHVVLGLSVALLVYLLLDRAHGHRQRTRRVARRSVEELDHAASDGTITVDDDLRILALDDGAQELFGYRAQEVMALPVEALVPEGLVEADRALPSPTLCSDRSERLDVLARHKDGTVFLAEASRARAERDGQVIQAVRLRVVTHPERVAHALNRVYAKLERRVDARAQVLLEANARLRAELHAHGQAAVEREQLIAECDRERCHAKAHASAAQSRAAKLEAAFAGMTDAVVAFDHDGVPVCMNAATRTMWFGNDASMPMDPGVLAHIVLRRPQGGALIPAELPWLRALKGETVRGERLMLTNLEGCELSVVISASPLLVEGRVSGAIAVCHDLTEYERLAVLEERQRLACELHDSLSQALYGIALGAHTAHAQLERDRTKASEALDYILALADAGLTEMRALIFELRPDSLTTEGLTQALRRLAEVTRTRHGLQVHAAFDREPEASATIKDAIYRIAQEALNNVVKHAQAKRVHLRLSESPEHVALEIVDDGVGFDPKRSSPGHLGLHSMRERAQRLEGRLEVHAALGHGTRISVYLPKAARGAVRDKVSQPITFSRKVKFSPSPPARPPVHLCAPQRAPAREAEHPALAVADPRVGRS